MRHVTSRIHTPRVTTEVPTRGTASACRIVVPSTPGGLAVRRSQSARGLAWPLHVALMPTEYQAARILGAPPRFPNCMGVLQCVQSRAHSRCQSSLHTARALVSVAALDSLTSAPQNVSFAMGSKKRSPTQLAAAAHAPQKTKAGAYSDYSSCACFAR